MDKVKVTLKEDCMWQGEQFSKGEHNVPEAMAIALGLKTEPTKKATSSKEDKEDK